MKQVLNSSEFDIGLFQEVLGQHRYEEDIPHQIEQLADEKWKEFSFAKNSMIRNYEHGNCILSKFPIIEEKVLDLTLNRLEKRSAILTKLNLGQTSIYCICTHLNLGQKDRLIQAQLILNFIDKNIGPDKPIVVGGDFNDWNGKVTRYFQEEGGFATIASTAPLNSFPSFFPVLPLDRILSRNIEINSMERGKIELFRKYSDHLPLFCTIEVS